MLAKMVLNSFILPNKPASGSAPLIPLDQYSSTLSLFSILLAAVLLSQIIKEHSITDLYLVGFAGLAQLTPGMLASIYLPKANRRGIYYRLCSAASQCG